MAPPCGDNEHFSLTPFVSTDVYFLFINIRVCVSSMNFRRRWWSKSPGVTHRRRLVLAVRVRHRMRTLACVTDAARRDSQCPAPAPDQSRPAPSSVLDQRASRRNNCRWMLSSPVVHRRCYGNYIWYIKCDVLELVRGRARLAPRGGIRGKSPARKEFWFICSPVSASDGCKMSFSFWWITSENWSKCIFLSNSTW